MDILLLIVDSLRAASVEGLGRPGETAHTPFLASLQTRMATFTRAYATECWTLPTHASMFTGLLPSEHGAHFQSMAYRGTAPTIAERLAAAGYATELATRNPILDGSLPGITRGFQIRTPILSARASGLNPLSIMLACSKPRFRRQIATSGFFHAGQRASRKFVTYFARTTVPADRELLAYLLERMQQHRRVGQPFFLCANLLDVHAPYPPVEQSIFRPWHSFRDWEENCTMPFVLPSLGSHAYLRPGFRLRARSRELLLGRYHDAIALADEKLETFFSTLAIRGLLDDLLLVITSDHGEAFGEHGLYLHDASVYDTHLHVPLYVHHPRQHPELIDDVVSARDIFGLLRRVGEDGTTAKTILDPAYRAAHLVARAEHFYYPGAPWAAPEFRQDLRATIVGTQKLVERDKATVLYDLDRDPCEAHPLPLPVGDSPVRGAPKASRQSI